MITMFLQDGDPIQGRGERGAREGQCTCAGPIAAPAPTQQFLHAWNMIGLWGVGLGWYEGLMHACLEDGLPQPGLNPGSNNSG